ncbi:hypothetical protein OsJ_13820 [Oryza sativa Japonica Group]|uniref:Uncharacterized protein n=1 Tax=Oryza sativa subsp. japonica TaxID=39947 RepID=A3AR24_ORYSJ|nr:hypothetical protein OsJ_13820 [Oryza sativa Japonica Group]
MATCGGRVSVEAWEGPGDLAGEASESWAADPGEWAAGLVMACVGETGPGEWAGLELTLGPPRPVVRVGLEAMLGQTGRWRPAVPGPLAGERPGAVGPSARKRSAVLAWPTLGPTQGR